MMKSKSVEKHSGGRPPKFRTEQELQLKIEEYFKSCWTQKINKFGDPIFLRDKRGKQTDIAVLIQNKPYTITGLALFLDTSRDVLIDYEAKPRFSNTIKRAKQRCLAYTEAYLFTGKNPRGAIFNLKNNWSWNK